MLTADEMEKLPEAAEQMMDDLARSILWEIIDRIKNGREITSTTDYLIYRYNAVRGFDKTMKKQIQSAIAATDAEIDRIFDDAMKQAYTRDAELYQNMLSKTLTPYEQNVEVIQYVDQVKRQTKSTMRNITNTSGYMIKVNGQYKMTPAAATLQNALDKVMGPLNLGGKTYEQAIREVVSELVESGLRTVTYASGRTYSVPAAVRMCIMTALTQVRARIVESEMDELEAEYVEVSWHKTARPSHQKWQGRVFHWDRGKTPENEARGALEGQRDERKELLENEQGISYNQDIQYGANGHGRNPVYYNAENDYSIHIEGLSDGVNQELSRVAKKVAQLGTKDGKEHMFLVALDGSTESYYETSGRADAVGYRYTGFIDEHPNVQFAFVHNHNTDSNFSETDLLTPIRTKEISMQIAVRNDGVIHYAVRKKMADKAFFPDEYYQDALSEVNRKSREGSITMIERMQEREKIIVECIMAEFYERVYSTDGRKN